MTSNSYTCVIPITENDYIMMRNDIGIILKYTQADKIVFIGAMSLKHLIEEDREKNQNISFLWEEELIPFRNVQDIYKKCYDRLYDNRTAGKISTVGWYYQQFLKLSYSLICKENYYLCWDADTIPLKSIDMINSEGKPFFDVKPELQKGYFQTINNLFGVGKMIEYSFVSEHMLFDRNLVCEMINEISEKASDHPVPYYEVIFDNINDLKLGFSEFETYGTWVAIRYPDKYRIRKWKSFRNAGFFIGREELTDDDREWLSGSYDAVSFERYQEKEPMLNELFHTPKYRLKLSAERFYLELLDMGIFGDYADGKIKNGDGYYPA